MEYTQLTPNEQIQKIDLDIKNYEGQHFEQKLFADQAQAAHDAVLDDDPDAETRRENFLKTKANHEATVREAEARIAVLKAARSLIESSAKSE